MKHIPILYSTDMVKAILAGNKTKTRRTIGLQFVNENPNDWLLQHPLRIDDRGHVFAHFISAKNHLDHAYCPSSYGKVGDVLWVRETWQGCFFEDKLKDGREGAGFVYKANEGDQEILDSFEDPVWRPSIFMPKSACRLFHKIKSIRVERLQDISEEDAIAEGVQSAECSGDDKFSCLSANCMKECIAKGTYYNYPTDFEGEPCNSAIESFEQLWTMINGPDNWEANPWVWVIEFERIEKPEGFGLQ